jgi:hypothetical protein
MENDTSAPTFHLLDVPVYASDIEMSRQSMYSKSQSRVATENVGLQREQKCNTFACHTCNEVRLCVLGIRKKEVGNTKR